MLCLRSGASLEYKGAMKSPLLNCLALLLLLLASRAGAEETGVLPVDAVEALRSASQVEIYSLEPWSRPDRTGREAFYGYEVLGRATLPPETSRIAVAEFEAVAKAPDGIAVLCFDPRHALRVERNGDTYDFLLCYDCGAMEVYRNGEHRVKVDAAGSSVTLNRLMEAAGLSLSQTAYKPPTPEDVARRQAELARWLDGMPASAKPLWERTERFRFGGGLRDEEMAALRTSLADELPDATARIRALLGWFGSGVGTWTGFPGWESVPEKLLLEFPTEELLHAVDWAHLDMAQREGAARLFASWSFVTAGEDAPGRLPLELRRAMLDHVLNTGEGDQTDRRRRARRAFGDVR